MLDERRLRRVMAAILKVPAESLGPDGSMDNIKSWDSLQHMNLVLALEEEFGVSIPDEDVGNITSYPLVKLVLEELLGAK